jgi:hypothetical protein
MQESWDHDSNEVIKVYLKLNNIWYEHYTYPSFPNGRYWDNYPIDFDSIADGIKITFDVHQEGYLCCEKADKHAEIIKDFTGNQAYPNTPDISSHCKSEYNFRTAFVWSWWVPGGIDMGWN